MSAQQAIELLSQIVGNQRAQDELGALNDVARLCGYLPLALRIAGAALYPVV